MTEERKAEIRAIFAAHNDADILALDRALSEWVSKQPDPEQAQKDIVTLSGDDAIAELDEWAEQARHCIRQPLSD